MATHSCKTESRFGREEKTEISEPEEEKINIFVSQKQARFQNWRCQSAQKAKKRDGTTNRRNGAKSTQKHWTTSPPPFQAEDKRFSVQRNRIAEIPESWSKHRKGHQVRCHVEKKIKGKNTHLTKEIQGNPIPLSSQTQYTLQNIFLRRTNNKNPTNTNG